VHELCVVLGRLLVHPDVAAGNLQLPPGRHRVTRIDHEVEQHLLELGGVGLDDARLWLEHRDQLDVLADEATEYAIHSTDDLVDVDGGGRRHFLPAGEDEQLVSEPGRLVRGGQDLLQVVSDRVLGRQPLHRQRGEADDGREEVVEVVGYAPGEAADALHLPGLPVLLLELHLTADVTLDREVSGDLTGAVPNRRDDGVLGEQGAVLASVDEPPPPLRTGRDGRPQVAIEGVVVAPTLEDPRVLPGNLGGGVTADSLEGRVDVDDAPVGPGDDDAVPGLLDGRLETTTCLAEPDPGQRARHLTRNVHRQGDLVVAETPRPNRIEAEAAHHLPVDDQGHHQQGDRATGRQEVVQPRQPLVVGHVLGDERHPALDQLLVRRVALHRNPLAEGRRPALGEILCDDHGLGPVVCQHRRRRLRHLQSPRQLAAGDLEQAFRLHVRGGSRHHPVEQRELPVPPAQLVLCLTTLGHVDGVLDHLGDIALPVEQRIAVDLEVAGAPLGIVVDMLDGDRPAGPLDLPQWARMIRAVARCGPRMGRLVAGHCVLGSERPCR